jgi:hypothetical protein
MDPWPNSYFFFFAFFAGAFFFAAIDFHPLSLKQDGIRFWL